MGTATGTRTLTQYELTAKHLAEQAALMIAAGESDRALWRLVDAAGLIASHEDWKGVGADAASGRGFQIVRG